MKKGKGLRFGYYSNSPDFLDLLSFQTTLVIDAKINKMCCTAKENICFFLSSRLFFCYFDGLIVLLKSFSSSVGTSYALCLRKLRYRHNLFLPLAWPTKRGRELPVEKDFGKSASCHFSVYRPYFLRYGFSARQFFRFFFFDVFSFLGSSCKSRIVCRRRSRSYSDGDKFLTRLSPTPSTYLTKP